MPKRKTVIELSCRHDPNDPEHLLCVERASTESATMCKRRSWKHHLGDILLIALVLTFAAVQINAMRSKISPIPAADVEVAMTASPSAVRVGEEAALTISYLNGSKQALSDPRLTLHLPDSLRVRTATGGRWEAETSTLFLDDIPAVRSGESSILLDTLSIDEATIEAVLEYRDSRGRIYSRKVNARVSLRGPGLSLESFARYYSPEGDQIGRGPLPPKAGEATKYKVFFVMGKILSDFENVIAEGRLQEGVRWTGFTPGDGTALRFDPVSRIVTWRVGDAHAYFEPGYDEDIKGVVFEIAFTPNASMVGKEMPLINDISIHGMETKTGKIIEQKNGTITANLFRDSKAVGKGIVQP